MAEKLPQTPEGSDAKSEYLKKLEKIPFKENDGKIVRRNLMSAQRAYEGLFHFVIALEKSSLSPDIDYNKLNENSAVYEIDRLIAPEGTPLQPLRTLLNDEEAFSVFNFELFRDQENGAFIALGVAAKNLGIYPFTFQNGFLNLMLELADHIKPASRAKELKAHMRDKQMKPDIANRPLTRKQAKIMFSALYDVAKVYNASVSKKSRINLSQLNVESELEKLLIGLNLTQNETHVTNEEVRLFYTPSESEGGGLQALEKNAVLFGVTDFKNKHGVRKIFETIPKFFPEGSAKNDLEAAISKIKFVEDEGKKAFEQASTKNRRILQALQMTKIALESEKGLPEPFIVTSEKGVQKMLEAVRNLGHHFVVFDMKQVAELAEQGYGSLTLSAKHFGITGLNSAGGVKKLVSHYASLIDAGKVQDQLIEDLNEIPFKNEDGRQISEKKPSQSRRLQKALFLVIKAHNKLYPDKALKFDKLWSSEQIDVLHARMVELSEK